MRQYDLSPNSAAFYCCFLVFTAISVVFCIKKVLSKNFKTSSMRLEHMLEGVQSSNMEVSGDLHDWCADDQHRLPFRPVKRQNREESLQERCVQQTKVQRHRQSNSVHQHHVVPQRQSQE